ncbi:MAG: iron-siderophore ABC transporter substrate-binding protein [Chloroflexota bacterium]|nr:iron-siderophore ABC transporter substrate-binding protein [Chloroflexota bacterium]
MSTLNRRVFIGSSVAVALAGGGSISAQTPASPGAERAVEHSSGTTTLTGEPQRVVALEWSLVEHALALGVQPVGVADVEGYRELVNVPLELNDDVADVGTRQEPSVEAIAALEPDLILAIDWRHEAIHEQLSTLAPTVQVPFDVRGDDITPLQNLHDRLMVIGEALNRQEQAEAIYAKMEETLAEQANRIEAAGLSGSQFVFAYWYTSDDQPTLRLFSNEHIVAEAITQLGLENAWEDQGEESGFSTVGYEALASLPEDIHFIFVPADEDAFQEQLDNDPILSSLPYVQESRAYGLPSDTWTNPGAIGVEVLVTRVADALTGQAAE